MTRTRRTFGHTLALFAVTVATVSAQTTGGVTPAQMRTAAQLRNMIIEDSLTPAKKQLRDFVAELRDSLNYVQAIRSSIDRNLTTGTNSVVVSNARVLGKRCRMAMGMADLTGKRVATMYANDPRGDQALNAYRAGLTALMDDMQGCQRDDSLVITAAKPDGKRIKEVASAADDAINRYDMIRDGLLKLLNIDLPIAGKIHAVH